MAQDVGEGSGGVTSDEGTTFRSPLLDAVKAIVTNPGVYVFSIGKTTYRLNDPRLTDDERFRYLRDRMMEVVSKV